jgi:hypothetical protein
MLGAVLFPNRHFLNARWLKRRGRSDAVTRVIASVAERSGKHLASYRRFFGRARWEPDGLFGTAHRSLRAPGRDERRNPSGRCGSDTRKFAEDLENTLAAAA